MPVPILSLPVTMIEPALGTLLVPFIRASPLVKAGLLAALAATVRVPAIAGRAKIEHGTTVPIAAIAPPQNQFAVHCSHGFIAKGSERTSGVRYAPCRDSVDSTATMTVGMSL
jgi:hypothetical protein